MKNTVLILFVCFVVLFSCRKTYVTNVFPAKHDTTTINTNTTIAIKTTLLGNWLTLPPVSVNPSDTLIFGVGSYVWNYSSYMPSHKYFASPDTIYQLHSDFGLSAEYGYKISNTNDTLILFPTFHYNTPTITLIRY